jgi:hypothetical protein
VRRGSVILLVLLLALPAFSAELRLIADPALDQRVVAAIEEGLSRGLLSRLGPDEVLEATLDQELMLTVVVGERNLQLDLSHWVGDLSTYLMKTLAWDGYGVLAKKSGPTLEYPVNGGFTASMPSDSITRGRQFWVLDGSAKRVGSVVVSDILVGQEPSLLLIQSSGDRLFSGMEITAKGKHSLFVHTDLSVDGEVHISLGLSHPLSIYPMGLLYAVSYEPLASAVCLEAGVFSRLYFSHLFSSLGALSRNLSLQGEARVGLGWRPGLGSVEVLTEARIVLIWQIGPWAVHLYGGNRLAATVDAVTSRGLFFGLGTAYTDI